ncbi:MAG: CvpA family protein [Bacteroidetes bacterium]|nr:MAG: CvpA family protein [Bacteroidota bacterium]
MPIDIICLAAFFYGFWRGFNQGIISAVFNILAYVFGIVLAFKMTPTVTNILESLFNSNNPMMFIAAFFVNMVFIMFIIRQAARGFTGILEKLYLNSINRMIGGVILGFIGVLIFSILVWFADKAGMIGEQTLAESRTYPYLIQMPGRARVIADRAKPFLIEGWENSIKWMDRLEEYGEQQTGVTGGNGDQPRIYELPDDGSSGIEDEPAPSRSQNRPIYEDDGSGIED